MRGGRRRS